MMVNGIIVKGVQVDKNTRCKHYAIDKDIIAIKFKCCNTYFPCYRCHEEVADHTPVLWGKDERDTKAILCGACGTELTIREYLNCGAKCPNCKSLFNGSCSSHYHVYFE